MIHSLDMPEGVAEKAAWLDRQLVSEDLAAIVDELSAIHGAADEDLSAEEGRAWLGQDAEKVLSFGLSGLSQGRLREVLRRPSLLLAIQEIVLLEGGSYWDRLVREAQPVPPFRTYSGTVETSDGPVLRRLGGWARGPILLGILPIAVAATIGLFIQRENFQNKPKVGVNGVAITRGIDNEGDPESVADASSSWGWTSADLVAAGTPPEMVSSVLADSLEDWFRVTAESEADVKQLQMRASELWAACDRVASLKWEGMSKESLQAVHDVAISLQTAVQAMLKDLRQSPDAQNPTARGRRAKEMADSAVRKAIEQLRQIR